MPTDEAMTERSGRILEAALDLFDAQGFDDTTIDQIASAAGVSASTISREIGTKDDFLLSAITLTVTQMKERIRARPSHEPPLVALRELMVSRGSELISDPIRFRQLVHLMSNDAVLGKVTADHTLIHGLTEAFSERPGVTRDQAEIIAIYGAAIVRYVFEQSARTGEADPARLVRKVFRVSHEAWKNFPIIG